MNKLWTSREVVEAAMRDGTANLEFETYKEANTSASSIRQWLKYNDYQTRVSVHRKDCIVTVIRSNDINPPAQAVRATVSTERQGQAGSDDVPTSAVPDCKPTKIPFANIGARFAAILRRWSAVAAPGAPPAQRTPQGDYHSDRLDNARPVSPAAFEGAQVLQRLGIPNDPQRPSQPVGSIVVRSGEKPGAVYSPARISDLVVVPNVDKLRLESLIVEFEAAVKREIDRSLAVRLRRELLDRDPPRLTRGTVLQLARWCNTEGPVYWDGMAVAVKISQLLFGLVVDRHVLGT